MVFQYLAYDKKGQMTKGSLSATNETAAADLLSYSGYQVISLKQMTRRLDFDGLRSRLSKVKPVEIVLLYRQLALLLRSGINIITALELLQDQVSSRRLTEALGEVISDLRGGSQLSAALGKHPDIFSTTSCRLLHIGEESGDFETTLTHLADYIERELTAVKGLKGALTYPAIAMVVCMGVVGVLVTFVLPAFGDLYDSMGAELPTLTKLLIDTGNLARSYWYYGIAILAIGIVATVAYIRTPQGRYRRDKLLLSLPVIGRINHLKELGRACRSIALLFKAGLPVTEIIHLTSQLSGNVVITRAFTQVEQDMINGEGLSQPMDKNPVFLPLMVHMVRIGEETGYLDTNLEAVAQTYEVEAEDKTRSLTALIQPAMTLVIGGIVGLIALSLTSAMYSIYGQAL